MTWINALVAVIGALGVIWGAYTAYTKAKAESTSSTVSQWQQLYNGQEQRHKDLEGKVEAVERRLDAATRRERMRDDYIMELRQHIADGKPPPPPAWPADLIRDVSKYVE